MYQHSQKRKPHDVRIRTNKSSDRPVHGSTSGHMAGERELLECADAMSPYGWFERIMLGVEPYVNN